MKFIKLFLLASLQLLDIYKGSCGKQHRKNKILSEMIRNVHSIEKGMCIQNPRPYYGLKKISYLIDITNEYIDSGFPLERTELKMVCGALESYCQLFEENENTLKIKEFCKKLNSILGTENCNGYGGAISFEKTAHADSLQNAILSRHSIRDFAEGEVSEELLLQAIELANHCPSACNRQTTSVYILERKKIPSLLSWLSGTGGFAECVDKFLIITGRSSAYNLGEAYQYIVNAGIFAGYLSLCLSDLGVGNCIVQRSLTHSKFWKNFAKQNNISSDEHIVCLVAVGQLKDTCKVPVSYKLPTNDIARKL